MKDNSIKKLVYAALFAALCCVATLVIMIPTPMGGYINAGDVPVLLAAYILGPAWGSLAAGVGTALADIISGYVPYAPATLVIKGLVAFTAAGLLKKFADKKPLPAALISGLVSETLMVAGYFVYEYFILGFGIASVANIPMNAIQAVFSAVAATALFVSISKRIDKR